MKCPICGAPVGERDPEIDMPRCLGKHRHAVFGAAGRTDLQRFMSYCWACGDVKPIAHQCVEWKTAYHLSGRAGGVY